jgi:hypothetical protein
MAGAATAAVAAAPAAETFKNSRRFIQALLLKRFPRNPLGLLAALSHRDSAAKTLGSALM